MLAELEFLADEQIADAACWPVCAMVMFVLKE